MRKNKHSRITWITFLAFSLAPIMGGVFVIILRHPELIAKAGMLSTKAKSVTFLPDWNSYFSLLSQAVGVGGVLVFGFVASWIFGREFSDGTSKDLLSLPTSRSAILNMKFVTYFIWCIGLALSNLIVGFTIGSILHLDGWREGITLCNVYLYLITTLLTVGLGTPVAFFAIAGEGYLAPLGIVALTLVLAQIIAATGFGSYFPWSIPGLYSGAAGEYRDQLNWISYGLHFLLTVSGYLASRGWFKYFDQVK